MKKIMYVVKYMPNEYNSVGDILNCIVDMPGMEKYEQIIAQCDGHSFCKTNIDYIKNFKCFNANILSIKSMIADSKINIREKIKLIFNKFILYFLQKTNSSDTFLSESNEEYLDSIIKKEQPDLVVFFVYSPEEKYADACKNNDTKYVYMLYDTYIARPDLNKNAAYKKEKYVIDNSKAYFVPEFFVDEYYKIYGSDKIVSYKLPLLIDEESVKKAFSKPSKHEFTYFGQIQNFRNGETIKNIFKKLNKSLDIFTNQNDCEGDETFVIHEAITGDELFSVVAGSEFLVAFDNSAPYNMYLPSKAYLYVSFTKPIIIFGDNEKSALKDFFADYPKVYYQNINEPTDGLNDFIAENNNNLFDEEIYSRYSKYLPSNALSDFTEIVDKILG